MAGLSDSGWETKRFPEITTELKNKAVELFKDLLEDVNDTVDTSDDTTIGRFIGLVTPSLVQLWEASQEVYSSNDPNSATGIALDNLVAYAALSRKGPSASIAQMGVTGTTGGTVLQGTAVRSSVSDIVYTTIRDVTLTPDLAFGIGITPLVVLPETVYSFEYSTGGFALTVSYTSGLTTTLVDILNGLALVIKVSHPQLTTSIQGDLLFVDKREVFESSQFTVSSTLALSKVRRIVEATADRDGPSKQPATTVNQIITPSISLDSAYNVTETTDGSFTETDPELRERFRTSKAVRALNILESLISSLLEVPEVSSVRVYENYTDITDGFGVPPHSFKAVILGGDSANLAQAIWKNKPLGIRSSGNTVITVIDSQGSPQDVRFDRPTPVPMFVQVALQVTNAFPANGVDDIRVSIVEYVQATFGVGDSIPLSRLYTPINEVPGHQVLSLNIGTRIEELSSSNITLSFDEVVSLSTSNIEVILQGI